MSIEFYSPRHHNLSFLLKRWTAYTIILIIVSFLLKFLLHGEYSLATPFSLFFISLMLWIDLAREDRVNKFSIDRTKLLIHFNYYDINQGQVKKSFSFKGTRIKITRSEIYFFAGRKETFIISKAKDGFDKKTMNEIRETLENLTSPV